MVNKGCILIVGGAGFIGSYVNKRIAQAGYRTIIIDNLSQGDKKAVTTGELIIGDVSDRQLLERVFKEDQIEAVMHFAAFADVGESIAAPFEYYQNNVAATLVLLEAMVHHRCLKFIFSSSAAIFGTPVTEVIREDHRKEPISPYGRSKWMVEQILQDFDRAYGLKSISLRYFNAAGGDPEGVLKNYKKREHNLIPLLLRTIQSGRKKAVVFGDDYQTFDGTCVRDYIHLDDLASAHQLALEQLFRDDPSSAQYNLGNGRGYSVLEVIAAVQAVTQTQLCVTKGPRREGDPACLIASGEKAKEELGWQPMRQALEVIVEDAWRSFL